jgi:hypothetical protein
MNSPKELYLFFLEWLGILAFVTVAVVSIYYYLKDVMQLKINSGKVWSEEQSGNN